MNRKIYIAIIIIIVGAAALVAMEKLGPIGVFRSPAGGVQFKLIDGDTGQPISNQEITVCDDSLKYKRLDVPGEEYKGFCNDPNRKEWARVMTDQEGKFSLDVKRINIRPPAHIMVDPGKEYRAIGISRLDTILRVMNQAKSGHVVSNLSYNLDTKEVKEGFTNGDPERTYAFDAVILTTFRMPKNRNDSGSSGKQLRLPNGTIELTGQIDEIPEYNALYVLSGSGIYDELDPNNRGPAAASTSMAWSLANEFVYRTGLRNVYKLPAQFTGPMSQTGLYESRFRSMSGDRVISVRVDIQNRTVELLE